MVNKTKYDSPIAEILTMSLEGIICGSDPDTDGMTVGNPFGDNTEEIW